MIFEAIHLGVATATVIVVVFGKVVSIDSISSLGSFVIYSYKSINILVIILINHFYLTHNESHSLTILNI